MRSCKSLYHSAATCNIKCLLKIKCRPGRLKCFEACKKENFHNNKEYQNVFPFAGRAQGNISLLSQQKGTDTDQSVLKRKGAPMSLVSRMHKCMRVDTLYTL